MSYSRLNFVIFFRINEYLVNTLLFSLQSLQWYGKYVTRDPGLTIDSSNKYLGIVRYRQHRSEIKKCRIQIDNMICRSTFSEGPEYRNFGECWDSVSTSDSFSRMGSIWQYKSASETGTWSNFGKKNVLFYLVVLTELLFDLLVSIYNIGLLYAVQFVKTS